MTKRRFSGDHESMPRPSKGEPSNSAVKCVWIEKPPGPLRILYSPSDIDSPIEILASQSPTRRCSTACSGPGVGIGGPALSTANDISAISPLSGLALFDESVEVHAEARDRNNKTGHTFMDSPGEGQAASGGGW